MRIPKVELLWWEGCPSTERALAELRESLRDVGLESTEVIVREIKTDADAQRVGFSGSPTILVDGSDPADSRENEQPIGLSCRIYRRRDGRISPTPDPDDLRAALRRAARQVEVSP